MQDVALAPVVADDDGYWEVIWNHNVIEFPSLAELFEWLTRNRTEVQHRNKILQILWRWDGQPGEAG